MYEKDVLKLKIYQIAFLLFMLDKDKKTAVSYLYSSDKIIILGNSSGFSVPWYELTILGTK